MAALAATSIRMDHSACSNSFIDSPLLATIPTPFGLLRLSPAAIDSESLNDTIWCDLTVNEREQWRYLYFALSYAWSPPTPSFEIRVNGQPFTLRANLFYFLKCYRMHILEPVFLWIDAISIDQSDELERNDQVALMDVIHQVAAKVISWLGPLNELLGLPATNGHNENADLTQQFPQNLRMTLAGLPMKIVRTDLVEVRHNIRQLLQSHVDMSRTCPGTEHRLSRWSVHALSK